jgi:hypothetical protein
MAKLVLSSDGTIVGQRFLDEGRITIGRDPGNDIVVDDPAVGATHAAISVVGHDFIVEDLGSGAGTRVNGVPAQRRVLQHGDIVELGAHHLRYLDSKASSDIDLDRTMLISGLMPALEAARADGVAVDETLLRVPSARVARARVPSGRVTWTDGPHRGRTQVLDRVVATFGSQDRDVVVVTRRPRGYFVTHVAGDGSARLNGAPLGAEAHPLRDGDLIEVAGDRIRFEAQ